ncbi:hypothetical protein [Kineococcus sp. SYSU DK005]|uniref:hypothetical protein n=1 Tax=Kineococcus sp. SYSU DK005 TaxID=3383126 RepID=UPI003D7D2EED
MPAEQSLIAYAPQQLGQEPAWWAVATARQGSLVIQVSVQACGVRAEEVVGQASALLEQSLR